MPGEPILVVDDNVTNLKLLRVLLAQEGFEVRTAKDAPEALAVLEGFRPALILMDIQLPGMSGLELTRQLRNWPELAQVPILALTAYAMKTDEEAALEAGCNGFLAKPIDTRSLTSVIRSYLEAHRGSAP